jgi:hypothetical protein
MVMSIVVILPIALGGLPQEHVIEPYPVVVSDMDNYYD